MLANDIEKLYFNLITPLRDGIKNNCSASDKYDLLM